MSLRIKHLVMVLFATLLVATPSLADMDVYLAAQAFQKDVFRDGLFDQIPMWGFAEADPGFTSIDPPSVPGPMIQVPSSESVLRRHLKAGLQRGEPACSDQWPGPEFPGPPCLQTSAARKLLP